MQENNVSTLELTEASKDRNELTSESKRKEENKGKAAYKAFLNLENLKNLYKSSVAEQFLLCFYFPIYLSSPAQRKLSLEKACRSDLKYTEELCFLIVNGNTTENTTIAGNEVLTLIANVVAWQTPMQTGIPAILMLFVGAWSDKTGNRKLLMIIPMLGQLIVSVGLLFSVYFYLECSLWATALIESLPNALSGGIAVALMGTYSYIADTTPVESRTFRIAVLATIVTLSGPIGTSIGGVLTEVISYYGVFSIGAVLNLIGFIHICFKVQDVKRVPMEGTWKDKINDFFNPKHVWETISLLFLTRKAQLIQIILVMSTHILIFGPVVGETILMNLYALKKYSMANEEYSYFETYTTLAKSAGTLVTATVFSKWLKMDDTILGIIATSSRFMSSIVFSLGPTKAWFYAGPIVDLFGNSGTSVIRSLGTKVVDEDKVGKMISLIGLLDALIPVIYSPLYSKVYTSTIDSFTGAFCMLGAVMTVPAYFTFIFLYFMRRREARDQVKNPDEKEQHAYENAMTPL